MAIPQPRSIPIVNKAKPVESLGQGLHGWNKFLMSMFCSFNVGSQKERPHKISRNLNLYLGI
jgi:hypothetical protein